MYAYGLSLLVLAAAAAHAYPVASNSPESLALVAARRIPRVVGDGPRAERRQIHNADYQANSPPPSPNHGPAQDESSPAKPAPSEPVPKDKQQIHNADYQANGPLPSPNHGPPKTNRPLLSPAKPAPCEPVPKDKRADSVLWRGSGVPSSPRSLRKTDDEVDVERNIPRIKATDATIDEKRQIHNADYQANGPPPSPNPGPATEESSPVNPPATAPSSSASKEKRALEHTPASTLDLKLVRGREQCYDEEAVSEREGYPRGGQSHPPRLQSRFAHRRRWLVWLAQTQRRGADERPQPRL
ncbi:hypothetical protein B0H14DRAFT_2631269 [Mycena olivaceomarginata]|nr:hypothetical protein B0H14DRAFT_2631269 [Mycena olivaceomarginata]